jgi:hypothetical protein
MATWLFTSRGEPVAFIARSKVFSRAGQFVGKLHGHEVWNGHYVGEIVRGTRILRRNDKFSASRKRPDPPGPPHAVPKLPAPSGAIAMSARYSDVDFAE